MDDEGQKKASSSIPSIVDNLLTINPFSRSGKHLDRVMALVIHNLGVGGQRAKEARNYWESLKSQDEMDARPDISASAHFIIDLDGVIYRTLPENEKAYHCGATSYTPEAQVFFGNYCTNTNSSPNRVTIGIELAQLDDSGLFSQQTYHSAQILVRYLRSKYNLLRTGVWRHWDITRKDCPRWFINNGYAWDSFLN